MLLRNPYFGDDSEQIQADLLLYFELKSRDHYRTDHSQLKAHLDAISSDRLARNAFLAVIGGKPVDIQHRCWLGHVTLRRFLEVMSQVAAKKFHNRRLADEIEHLSRVLI